jgi:dolichol-phosphate mannosyltransferase
VIPARNEEASIEAVVRGALRHAPVCVVDDASRDRTAEIVAGIPGARLIRHARNTHIREAVLDGVRAVLADGCAHVVTMDAGLSHDPAELPHFLAAPPADLVIGTRSLRPLRGRPLHRTALSLAGSVATNALLAGAPREGPRWIRDCTSGYRRYSRRALEVLLAAPLRSRAFDFLLESLVVIARAGLTIREVPISYRFTSSSLDRAVVAEALRTWWRLRTPA